MRKALSFWLVEICLLATPSAGAPAGDLPGQRGRLLDRHIERLQSSLVNRRFDDALAAVNDLLRLDPANYQYHNLRGVVEERLTHYSEATPSYAKALELQPTSSTVRLNLALNYLRVDRFADAAREFAVLIDQGSPQTLQAAPNPYQQAPVTLELERFARSLRTEEVQYFSLGRLFLAHRLAEAALTVFFTGTQVLPKSGVIYYGLGWSFQEMNKSDEAQAAFRKALQLRTNYFECCLRLGHSLLGINQTEKAIETYRDCVRMSPESYGSHYFLGRALLTGKTPGVAEAIVHLEQAIKLNPYSVDSRLELGKALAAEGAHSQALREFSIVARENPENQEAQYRLATLYRTLGQGDKAREYLERFEVLKARELARMKQESLFNPIGLSVSTLGKTVDAVAAFYESFRKAVVQRNFGEIWNMLTDRSRTLYGEDRNRFLEIWNHLSPEVMDRIGRSSISGGKLVSGRIVCELAPVDGISLPPLVLVQQEDKLQMDYAFDLSLSGLAILGSRASTTLPHQKEIK